uniref:UDP-N-acetylglucosamine--dolichyl-phosphate N-acetylglucosaminephosphotransferase n=1 Tax=Kwoniella pini CBS 10737 TaxID=1296096 RepID=A0A1B9ICP5_9TREE|nr:UDP-N-acetylglucosamine-dolichyl-phosphate N-acetylglucosaminephosphotransferase [Kwoniella pini CBS 10737]OCF53263.1 UDP-N-acetylglucosamine-dolichyl-phosphate N-acetylglucosaminephosphotransferase [Kwoniella pini CBS 10737]
MTQKYGHRPPILLTLTILPISLILILNPLIPLIIPKWIFKFSTSLSSLIKEDEYKFPALQANLGFSLLAFIISIWLIPKVSESFILKGLKGRDLLKSGDKLNGPWVPESLGLPCASLYLALMMLFIPFPFSHLFKSHSFSSPETFPQRELTLYLSSLLSLLTATLLGFIDDLFDIRWRHKLPIPIVSAVPTLLVYYSVGGVTSIVLPKSIVGWLSSIGPIYYLYLIMLPTFTTNSINILAGINGVEVLQALIIAISISINDLIFLPIWSINLLNLFGFKNPENGRILNWAIGEVVNRHLMSLYFMIPLIGICLGFLWHNWYPAKAFPGDTFCYFTGMAFSAVAIQGHFSKTLILFFLPQIFNFILSCPQLFGLVKCPRHRLPSYDEKTNLLNPSKVLFDSSPPKKTIIVLKLLSILKLVKLEYDVDDNNNKEYIKSSTNLTILNFLLIHFGPLKEDKLCILMGLIQVLGSLIAFIIRYGVGSWFYGGERR